MKQTLIDLLPEERVLFETKKHVIIFLPSLIITIICCLFIFNSNPYIVKFTVLPALAALLSWINDLLTYYTSYFAVTNKRVILQEGFFVKHRNELRLTNIGNITVNQSLIGQFLNYGTLILFPFGGPADPFTNIKDPYTFLKYVQLEQNK